ncbi:ER membrane protein complex subunit 2 [Dermatophagoides farinae]|uniref:ER membrane protein complex subunit 2 n=1 Tax=Dermatophagoides farinae TaxID=6954 RepID=A0A922L0X8_DERFA|nr:ER membrane protein complex subunit 2-like [Dermatophagoides farinae]KAH7637180.1 tetratricopeptide repeat protein 35-like protein [Dermatophagoides farinae]KAH9510999.1 ER membrane complex subunit 2 [Dermatophagoides farinae]
MDPNKFESCDEFVSKLSKRESKELLQKWREENARNSELVRQIWLTKDLGSYLGDEKWVVLEQVCVAAMDLHDKTLIESCITQLLNKFPNSSRVKRLRMMAKLELTQRYDDAIAKYNELIANDESNSLLHKRKIAILIATRKNHLAIKASCDYLKNFMNDHEAWIQLSEFYIQEQEYAKAAFCVEELILSNPHNHLYHERYADIQYTIGTGDSLELARSYYAQATKLKPSSLHALYGLILSSNALATSPKTTASKKKEYILLAQWASNQISNIYKKNLSSSNSIEKANERLIDNIDSALEALSISN